MKTSYLRTKRGENKKKEEKERKEKKRKRPHALCALDDASLRQFARRRRVADNEDSSTMKPFGGGDDDEWCFLCFVTSHLSASLCVSMCVCRVVLCCDGLCEVVLSCLVLACAVVCCVGLCRAVHDSSLSIHAILSSWWSSSYHSPRSAYLC